MIELAFEFNKAKSDGSFEFYTNDINRLPKGRVVRIYDIHTGKGPKLFYVESIGGLGAGGYLHRLMPLPGGDKA